jgi:hypothetical protein
MPLALYFFASRTLTHLSAADVVVLLLYFALVLFIGFYVKDSANTSEEFFLAGREMTAWIAGLSFVAANLGSLELMGGVGVPVRHPGDALVLDRGHPCDAVSRHCNDALLLHLEDALGARLSAVALR